MTARQATCSCGRLAAAVTGEPVRNSVCDCLNCKRLTGSAFSWNATYDESQVQVTGEHSSFTVLSEEGFRGRHHFCPHCGVRVFYAIERRQGMITIPVGAFADPDFPPPTVEVYGERRCPWLPELAPEQT